MERHAAQAALDYIKDNMTIGLGSGRAVEYLIEFISMRNIPGLKVVTNSMATAIIAQKRGLDVIPSWMVKSLDYTFDSLDYVTKDLYGLKEKTSVIVEDKLLASMAKKFIMFVNEDNFGEVLTNGFVVEAEVAKPALSFAAGRLEEMNAAVAMSDPVSHEPVVSASGNYVIEAKFNTVQDLKALDLAISSIPGVISNSLFTNLNAAVLVYNKDEVKVFENAAE